MRKAWTLLFGTVGGGAPSEVNGQLRGRIFALSPVLGFPHKPTLSKTQVQMDFFQGCAVGS